MLSKNEKVRYKRHINLPLFGEEGQEKLKQSSVLVIGTGGLGAPVLNYLAAAGVGKMGIVDADVVDESNLQRQVLFTTNEIGQKKAEIARKKLKALNPNIQFEVWDVFFTHENGVEMASGFDLIINCTDNYDTRYASDEVCKTLNIPLVMGSIHNYEGQVSVFHYMGGPSYSEMFPQSPDKKIFNEKDLGVLGVLPSITGSLQASEAIKILTGVGEVLSGKLLVFSLLDNSFKTFKLL